ncbi:MAG: peptidoglycan editing factor PgeF [Polynucleobacter sp.]
MFDASIYGATSVPANIGILFTDRKGGFSLPPYDSLNLATHVGDDLSTVQKNRELLNSKLPNTPVWLNQVHGCEVFDADDWNGCQIPTADAAVTTKENQVLAIMTADCLPILLTSKCGSVVGAVHAGWRGLASGIVEKTIQAMQSKIITLHLDTNIQAYFGAAIGPKSFEVGEEVKTIFVEHDPQVSKLFIPTGRVGKYMADIYGLARNRLNAMKIHEIYGGQECTYKNMNFFSYRRDQVTGRMASLIWIKPSI